MQNTTNYNLKKPEYTDFADIADINDNMDTIDAQLAAPTGDSADSTTTFTTSDTADGGASSWTTVPALTSGETHKSLFAKMSQMFKNVRYLYKLLGTTDISSIGNGTVTNALSVLNAKTLNMVEPNTNTDASRISIIPDDRNWGGIQVSNGDTLNYGLFQICNDGRINITKCENDTATVYNELCAGYAPVITRSFSSSYSVGADGSYSQNITITVPNGYTPVGVVGYTCGSNRVNLYTCYLRNSNQVFFQLLNLTNATINNTFTVYVLFRYDGHSVYSVS